MSDTPTPTEADAPDPDVAVIDDTDAQTDLIVTGEGSAGDESDGGSSRSEAEASPDLQEQPDPNAITIVLNGEEVAARKGEMVIAAALRADEYVPHFCYHPRMSPVGMCRQCMVEVEGPRGPMMVVSCMTPVADGQIVNTATDGVKRAQEGMLEMLLANHPLDCPVCDKGGECPLQDQAFSHGPGESRFVEEKRHYDKPIPISDLVFLDRERCILCDRCTRFADEVAGDKLIHFTSRGNNTQVMTFPDEPFASYFSGNTVQICPVGALTAKPYRFKARPWDLSQQETTCTTCSVGCRAVIQSSRDEVLRVQGVDSEPVNWGWLCDRGRFNFEATKSDQRLAQPLVRGESGLTPTSWNAALDAAGRLVREALDSSGPAGIALLGGARGSNEDAFAWAQLADALGVEYRDAQFGDGLPAEVLGLPRATIADAAAASTVILLGPDLKEELPVLFLRLRDAADKRGTKIVEFTSVESGLSKYAWKSVRYEPGTSNGAISTALGDADIAEQLASGPVVIVIGRQNLAVPAAATVGALRTLRDALPAATFLPALRRGNVVGALSAGLAPADGDHDALATLHAAADGKIDLLLLVGADPINDCPDADLARRALAGARRVISVDTFPSESSQLADVVLAASAFGEKAGTTTNLEGRVSTLAQQVTPHGTSRPDWMIAIELGLRLGGRSLPADHPLRSVSTVAEVTDLLAGTVPAFGAVTSTALEVAGDGIVLAHEPAELPATSFTATPRNSYDYRLVVSRKLYDRAVGTEMSRSLAKLAPGAAAHVHPLDLDSLGVATGDEVKLVSAKASTIMPIVANPAVSRGTVWSPFNQPGGTVEEIIDVTAAVTDVRIERGLMLAIDPLVEQGLLWTPILLVLFKVVIVFVIGLVGTMFMVWYERKVVSGMQNRVGPNKAGPFGLLQTLADGMKLIFKEDLLPSRADRIVFRVAPFLAFVPAFLVWSVIPLGGDFSDGKDGSVEWFGHVTLVQLADPPMGILVVLALSSIAVYGIMLAGWSSGSKYPLLGSVRASAQMISYEAALGLSVAAVLLASGTLSTSGIVRLQDDLANWNVVSTGIVPFVIFVIAATAELNRPPFDLVEAEQELVGGFNTEYSAFSFALFFLAEFMNVITMSLVIVTLFLGGPQPVEINGVNVLWFLGPLSGTAWLVLKLFAFLYMYVWFRATLPRLRYDQLMDFGWKVLIPISLGWFLLLAALREFSPDGDWKDSLRVVAISLAVAVVCIGLFGAALRVSRANRDAADRSGVTS